MAKFEGRLAPDNAAKRKSLSCKESRPRGGQRSHAGTRAWFCRHFRLGGPAYLVAFHSRDEKVTYPFAGKTVRLPRWIISAPERGVSPSGLRYSERDTVGLTIAGLVLHAPLR